MTGCHSSVTDMARVRAAAVRVGEGDLVVVVGEETREVVRSVEGWVKIAVLKWGLSEDMVVVV